MGSENVHKLIQDTKDSGRTALLVPEAKKIYEEYGLAIPKFKPTQTFEEAISHAQQIGFPVVLKIISSDIIHKSDSARKYILK